MDREIYHTLCIVYYNNSLCVVYAITVYEYQRQIFFYGLGYFFQRSGEKFEKLVINIEFILYYRFFFFGFNGLRKECTITRGNNLPRDERTRGARGQKGGKEGEGGFFFTCNDNESGMIPNRINTQKEQKQRFSEETNAATQRQRCATRCVLFSDRYFFHFSFFLQHALFFFNYGVLFGLMGNGGAGRASQQHIGGGPPRFLAFLYTKLTPLAPKILNPQFF